MTDSANPQDEPEAAPEASGGDGPRGSFDPTQVRIETRTLTVDNLVERAAAGTLDLAEDVTPDPHWDETRRSHFIESLLLRVPLPAFYLDAAAGEPWLVVEGLHRLRALAAFVGTGSHGLVGLEYLGHLEGKTFEALPRHFQRRLLETQVTVHVIQEGTPPAVRENLFRRLNALGRPLEDEEIRQLLDKDDAG